MNQKKDISGIITIARRAGKLILGFDAVKEAIMTRQAKLILITADVSAKTEKETVFFAEKKNVPVKKMTLTQDDLMNLFGKQYGVLSVSDQGFAEKILSDYI
ncbi:MAG: ribosomal L7Ae/L30e/S12e/Gadd45 family protein [Ruminococcus sp.]|nr:ribosomal L7Ae/L30e/S12e/Gadd45 family protein [Ruminococcus sp.]